MMLRQIIIFGIVLVCFASVMVKATKHRDNLYTSLSKLKHTINFEQRLASAIDDYVDKETTRLETVRAIAEKILTPKIVSQNSDQDKEEPGEETLQKPKVVEYEPHPGLTHYTNPIAQLKLIRHGAAFRDFINWNQVLKPTDARLPKLLLQYMPTENDFLGSMEGLLRLYDVYNIDINTLLNGKLVDTSTLPFHEPKLPETLLARPPPLQPQLTYSDIGELTLHAINIRQLRSAADFLNFLTTDEADKAAANDSQRECLHLAGPQPSRACYVPVKRDQHRGEGSKGNSQTSVRKLLKKFDDITSLYENGTFKGRVDFINPTSFMEGDTEIAYKSLCSGKSSSYNKIVYDKWQSDIACDYTTLGNDPRLILSPLKREVLHVNPWLTVYHDVLRDADIAQVRTAGERRLTDSQVFAPTDADLTRDPRLARVQNYRVSQTSWVSYAALSPSLRHRIAAVTQTSMKTVEAIQLVNYGIGGHYEMHYDFARVMNESTFDPTEEGNRISTTIFYLGDVKSGGATVFPYLDIAVPPEKGSVAFWFNLDSSGEPDFMLLHAGCPQIIGDKWIGNVWHHERGQELWYPCTTVTTNDGEYIARLGSPRDMDAEPTTQRCRGRLVPDEFTG